MYHKRNKLLSTLLILSAVFGLLTCLAGDAHAAASVSYKAAKYDASTGVTYTNASVSNYTVVGSSTTSWNNGVWYVVNSGVSIDSRVLVSGEVNLLLCDGATLNAKKGITVASGNTLNIYGQSEGTGTLNAGNDLNNAAGIGGVSGQSGGTINIHGGTITAKGDSTTNPLAGGAGIGGGNEGAGGTITIYGGTVTGSVDYYGTGIGSGHYGSGGTITIYGGTVTGSTGENGAGIGSGYYGKDVNINIHGGTVNATGGYGATGIGAGSYGRGGTITITGGTVNATGGWNGVGIGAGGKGNSSQGGTIIITGGTVNANCNDGGIGMGVGKEGYTGTITLSYTNTNDSITAASYRGTVTISDDKYFVDGNSVYYGGRLADNHTTAAAGQTLKPVTDVYVIARGTDNGLSVDKSAAKAGDTVNYSYSASIPAGYSGATLYCNSTAISGNSFTMPSENVTITVSFTPIVYSIGYTLNSGNADNPETYTIETETFSLNNPTRTGYTFSGWTGSNGDTPNQGITIVQGSTGDLNYTANWTANTYTLSFDANGGTGDMTALSCTYDSIIPSLPDNKYTRTGYTFSE